MTRHVNRLLVVVLAAIWPATCFAGAAEVVACRDIKDNAERLACFDRTVGGLATDLAAQHKSGTDIFGLSSAKPTTEQEFGLPPGKAPKAPKEAKEAPQDKSKDAPQDATAQPAPKAESHTVPPVTSMADKLTAIAVEDGKPVFYFENGQVWAAQESRYITFHGDGSDHAVVKRGWVGYLLTVNDSSAEISVRRLR